MKDKEESAKVRVEPVRRVSPDLIKLARALIRLAQDEYKKEQEDTASEVETPKEAA